VSVSGIISAIIVGVIIGVIGRLVVPGRQNISMLVTVAVGIISAFIGSALARAAGVSTTGGLDWIEFFFQVVLAAINVALAARLLGRRRGAGGGATPGGVAR
jgi:uncharacterized membrane protein YeaQ/YmgE (transglycosylase-associated protein family)